MVLGAGGAARAIAFEAIQHKAKVMIINRSAQKANELAQEIGGEGMGLANAPHLVKMDYTVLINTLPNTAYSSPALQEWLRPSHLSPGKIAMDIVYDPVLTFFLQAARDVNNLCIYGHKMYIHQALLQIQLWFAPNAHQLGEIKNNMAHYFLKGPLGTSDNGAVIL